MSGAWLFRVEVTGFPQTGVTEPIEVYGGHYEWWAVRASDLNEAERLIHRKVYSRFRFDRELDAAEVAGWKLVPGIPLHVAGW